MKTAEEIFAIIQSEMRRNGQLAQNTKARMEAAVLSRDYKEADEMFAMHKQFQANYILLADLMVKVTTEVKPE